MNNSALVTEYYHEEAPFSACMAEISDDFRPLIGSSVYQQIEIDGWDIFYGGSRIRSLLRLREVVAGGD